MPTKKQLIAAAAIAGGVAVGSVGGALIGAPLTSSAQEPDTSTTTEDTTGSRDGFGRFGGRHHPGHIALSTAAEAIGVSEADLRAALEDGQSIAQVAEANGVDVQVVIDALVVEATARVDEAAADGRIDEARAEEIKANLVDRITEAVNREDGFRMGPGRGQHFRHVALDIAADAIGISEDELRAALVDGQSVAEVAEANSVDPQVVIDALVADATTRITDAVNGED